MSHVATITIDHTKVPGDLTDYVGLIVPDGSAGYSALYALCLEGGGDIRLFKSDDTTELAREIVTFSVTDETGEIHYRYTGTLSSSVDTAIHVYADGSSSDYAVGATYGRNAVWADYELVLHLGETANNTSAGYVDSTGNGHNGTGNSMALAAGGSPPFGGNAARFDGSADWIDVAINSLSFTAFTYSVWAKQTSATLTNASPITYWGGGYTPFLGYYFDNSSNKYEAFTWPNGSTNTRITDSVDPDNELNNWQAMHITDTGSAQAAYRDAVSKGTTSHTTGTYSAFGSINIARNSTDQPTRFLTGFVKEIRLKSSSDSNNAITTEYNNQNSYSTFYSVAAVAGGSAAQAARRGVIMMM